MILIGKERKKMQELTRNIPWEFTDKLVTPWGGMRLMK